MASLYTISSIYWSTKYLLSVFISAWLLHEVEYDVTFDGSQCYVCQLKQHSSEGAQEAPATAK